MERVYLGLGGNLGDTARVLSEAAVELGRHLHRARSASLYLSAARYYENQPDFVNTVIEAETDLSPRELLAMVNEVEAAFGRDRSLEVSKGPRSLDIDILLFGQRIVAEDGLIIPHPGLRERKFALLPLVELSPGHRDPVSGSLYSRILADLPSQGIYLLGRADYDLLYI